MDRERESPVYAQRTTIDPSKDIVEMAMWVPPIKCEGCGSRVNTFYRYNRNTEARCTGCGSEWEITGSSNDSREER